MMVGAYFVGINSVAYKCSAIYKVSKGKHLVIFGRYANLKYKH